MIEEYRVVAMDGEGIFKTCSMENKSPAFEIAKSWAEVYKSKRVHIECHLIHGSPYADMYLDTDGNRYENIKDMNEHREDYEISTN